MVMLEILSACRSAGAFVLSCTVQNSDLKYRIVQYISMATDLAHAVVNENDRFKRSLCLHPTQQAPRRTAGSFFGGGQASVRKEGLCRGHAGRRSCALWELIKEFEVSAEHIAHKALELVDLKKNHRLALEEQHLVGSHR